MPRSTVGNAIQWDVIDPHVGVSDVEKHHEPSTGE